MCIKATCRVYIAKRHTYHLRSFTHISISLSSSIEPHPWDTTYHLSEHACNVWGCGPCTLWARNTPARADPTSPRKCSSRLYYTARSCTARSVQYMRRNPSHRLCYYVDIWRTVNNNIVFGIMNRITLRSGDSSEMFLESPFSHAHKIYIFLCWGFSSCKHIISLKSLILI